MRLSSARVWERPSGRLRFTWRGMGRLQEFVVAPDASWVAAADKTGVVHLIPLDPVATAKAECPRELRPIERKRFRIGEAAEGEVAQ